jgi:chromatin segregation and condensation protein Rec8/ScpA/Scc1 (kleisin family)
LRTANRPPKISAGAARRKLASSPAAAILLTQQARDLARWAAQQSRERRQWRQNFPPEEEAVTVAEMIEYLQAQFGDASALDASALLAQQPTPLRRVYLFLAILEMARSQQLSIRQEGAFAGIALAPVLHL